MKVPWTAIVRTLGELVIDLVRGKLETPAEPRRQPLSHADSARQSRFARMAGPRCPKRLPTGERCARYAEHAGRCRFTARA